MNGKRFSEDKARRNGFYLALAVCLVAVGIAAWSTYDAVRSYKAPESQTQSDLEKMQNEDVRSGQETSSGRAAAGHGTAGKAVSSSSSLPEDVDPELPRNTHSSTVRQTTGSVTSKPASSEADSAPESSEPETSLPAETEQTEEPQIPANAPLYELSTQMVYPLQSQEITKAYSAGAPVYSETMKDWRIHTGMDQTATDGEEVHACANGQVKETYSDAMLGNVIVIEHGDYLFSYCGVGENFQVSSGDIVTKGQTIGTVTAVPSEAADAPHLHLEVRRDGVCMDPQSVIEGK